MKEMGWCNHPMMMMTKNLIRSCDQIARIPMNSSNHLNCLKNCCLTRTSKKETRQWPMPIAWIHLPMRILFHADLALSLLPRKKYPAEVQHLKIGGFS